MQQAHTPAATVGAIMLVSCSHTHASHSLVLMYDALQ